MNGTVAIAMAMYQYAHSAAVKSKRLKKTRIQAEELIEKEGSNASGNESGRTL